MFDLIAGLPLHPLIDHVVVIAIPATVLLALFMLLAGKGSKSFTYWLLGLSAVSFAAALIAKFSGEALSERVGMPLAHAQDGDRLVYAAGALFASVVVYSLFALKIVKLKNPPKMNVVLPRALAGLGLVPVLALTYVAGHSGAEAVWGSRINTATAELVGVGVGVGEVASAQPMAANVAQTTGGAAGQRTTTPGITPSEVAKHSSATSCWSSINGNVYDMTSYVNKHPGGAGVIKAICGKDGTQAFNGQHRGEGAPANVLTGLLVGPLQSAAAQTAPVMPGAPKAPVVPGAPGTPGRPTKPGSTSMTGHKSMPPAGAYGDEDDDDDDHGEYKKDGRDHDEDDDDEYEGEDHDDDDDDEKSSIISRLLDRFFD